MHETQSWPGILRNPVRLQGEWRHGSVGPPSGAFTLSGSSLRGAAGLPGFRDAQSQDALSSCAHLPTARAARERRPEECVRGQELLGGSFVLRALSRESRGEIQGGLRSILASFSGASRFFYASAAGVRPFPGRTALKAGQERLSVAVFPALWYFAALFFRGGGALSPPFPCLSAERRNSGVK